MQRTLPLNNRPFGVNSQEEIKFFSHVIPKKHQPNWLLVLRARDTHRLAQKDQGGKMWWSKIPQRAKPEKCFAEPEPPNVR